MSATLLEYGAVRFEMLLTQELTVTPEYDPSGVDHLWDLFTLRVRGVLAPGIEPSRLAATPATPTEGGGDEEGGGDDEGDDEDEGEPTAPPPPPPPPPPYESPGATLKRVEHALLLPRRQLRYTVNDVDIVAVQEPPDARNGPIPKSVRAYRILEGSILVDWVVEVRVVTCTDAPSRNYASFRYNVTETINDRWLTTRQTAGVLMCRSDLRLNPDTLRGVVTPPVPNNFVREKASYTLSENGLEMRFEIFDAEQAVMPPSLAVKASGTCVQTSNKSGAVRRGQVDVKLEGPPGVSRQALMDQAQRVALIKLQSLGLTDPPLIDATFRERLWENVVECSISAQLKTVFRSGAAGYRASSVGSTPLCDSPKGVDPGTRTVLAPLLAAAFNDPCGQSDAPTGEGSGGYAGPTILIGSPRPTPPSALHAAGTPTDTSSPSYSQDDPGGFDHYLVETRLSRNEMRAQLPSTGGDGGSQSSGSDSRKCAIVRMANPICTLTVTWTAKRAGVPPVLPSYFSNDPNLVEMGGEVTATNIDVAGNSTSPVYEVGGVYTYAVRDPDQVSLFAPLPPFLNEQIAGAAKLAAAFTSDNILWRFKGADGPNPFVPARAGVAAKPNADLPQQLGAGLADGILGDTAAGAVEGAAAALNGAPQVNP